MTGARPALLAGIEAGGTKFVLVTGTAPDQIVARHALPTETPALTLAAAADWFAHQGPIAALGIASFGPIDLDPASPTWGHITQTPKPHWSHCDLAGYFARRLAIPLGFDTDVNAAALAEAEAAGAGAGRVLAYITVGTGIGGGLVVNGKPVHGAAHPEMGHVFVRRPADDQDFAGCCPFHGDCLEGLASGPAIRARWGAPLSDLAPDHPAHGIIAGYLAQLCHNIFATCAADEVVLGGGVMKTPGLLAHIIDQSTALDANYLPGRARQLIRLPRLGDNAGATGALWLAQRALEGADPH
ncbi:MAG: ROK family protein [Chakrabartia sp.]